MLFLGFGLKIGFVILEFLFALGDYLKIEFWNFAGFFRLSGLIWVVEFSGWVE